jgi:nucleoside-diphosphate-sugar epimerase
MKILITGHEGFIGSNLESFLKLQGHVVTGLDIKSGNDILVCELPDCDLVVHLAGVGGVRESLADPAKYWRNNVEGTKRILEHYYDKRVLVAGSSSQYEPHLNPYAASKHIIESIPHNNVVFMRFHTVYSSCPRKDMFFDKLIKGSIEYVTDHTRDFIHVDDVCSAVNILINSDYVGSIDVGTGKSIKISDIRPELPVRTQTPGERKHTLADTLKLSNLGFKPMYDVFNFIKNMHI